MQERLLAGIILASLLSIIVGVPAPNNGQSRIIGGEDSSIETSPYVVSLSASSLTYAHVCGGVMIGANWVLTAAHCVDEMNKLNNIIGLTVFAGLKDRNDYENGQKRVIDFAFKHKQFNGEIGSDDIALIHVSEPFEFNNRVRYATLPYEEESFDGLGSATFGWGLDDVNGFSYVSNLQVAKGEILSADKCRGVLPDDAPLSEKQVCVRVSACYGDGGGPLIAEREAWSSVLVGVTSWGYVPCISEHPTVYTNVAKYIKWILEVQYAHSILH